MNLQRWDEGGGYGRGEGLGRKCVRRGYCKTTSTSSGAGGHVCVKCPHLSREPSDLEGLGSKFAWVGWLSPDTLPCII